MGKRALAGQPGVLDVVKAMDNRPFGEWNIVYYNAAAIAPAQMVQRLKSNGCRDAAHIAPVTGAQGGVEVRLANPIITPGDWLQLEVVLPAGRSGQMKLAAPEGWVAPEGVTRNLALPVTRCDVQAPATAKSGRYPLVFTVQAGQAAPVAIRVEARVVSRVK